MLKLLPSSTTLRLSAPFYVRIIYGTDHLSELLSVSVVNAKNIDR